MSSGADMTDTCKSERVADDAMERSHSPAPVVPAPTPEPAADAVLSPAEKAEDEAMARKLKDLPREVGVMLMTVGALGWVLPGIIGTPALLAGGLVLWPKRFGKIESWFERKFPDLHHKSVHQIGRYLDDLEKRYPTGH